MMPIGDEPLIVSIGLLWSGIFTFIALGVWVILRLSVLALDAMAPKLPKSFPLSAQKMGFAQNLGAHSVIMSELDYRMRQERLSPLRRAARVWWPLVAWAALAQFMALYGAKGIAYELRIPFWAALCLTLSALGLLGLYRRSMIKDHMRETSLAEGEPLDWDAEAYVGGIRVRARFEGRARRVILSRLEQQALSKDRLEVYYHNGIAAQPEAVHSHGAGVIVSEFRMLDSANEVMSEQNWLSKLKLKDALHTVLSAYATGNSLKLPACALLEYPGAVIMVSPLAEHLEYLDSVGERLRKRKNASSMAAREIALAASQEFYTRFDERKVAELMAHERWISRDKMPI